MVEPLAAWLCRSNELLGLRHGVRARGTAGAMYIAGMQACTYFATKTAHCLRRVAGGERRACGHRTESSETPGHLATF